MKHVKEEKIAERHGGWTEWLQEIELPSSTARKLITVVEELGGNRSTSNGLGIDALYLIATMPEDSREQPHTVPTTYDEWAKQFPFWSVSTIRRIIKRLEDSELIITGNYNKMAIDKTKWYSVNYEEVSKLNRRAAQR